MLIFGESTQNMKIPNSGTKIKKYISDKANDKELELQGERRETHINVERLACTIKSS